MRLFLALKPDRTARAALGRLLSDVQRTLGDAASSLRWTPTENVHVTLHFLGEVDQARATRLRDALGSTVAVPPFELGFPSVELFPASGPPRVLWLSTSAPARELAAVHDQIGGRVEQVGLSREVRPFVAHLTLARVPDRERRRVGRLREPLAAMPVSPIVWVVDRVTLFQSDLSGPVPHYESIHEVTLDGRRGD